MPKGSGRRKSAQQSTELAESFRRARKALETATKDVVALRKRVMAKTPR